MDDALELEDVLQKEVDEADGRLRLDLFVLLVDLGILLLLVGLSCAWTVSHLLPEVALVVVVTHGWLVQVAIIWTTFSLRLLVSALHAGRHLGHQLLLA